MLLYYYNWFSKLGCFTMSFFVLKLERIFSVLFNLSLIYSNDTYI